MAQVIEMPKLSDTMAVGTVVKWHKTKGDTVSNGDILAEIETDKATMELENFDEGVLLDIIVEEGHEAPIGSPLAIVGDQNEDISSLIPSENIKDEVSLTSGHDYKTSTVTASSGKRRYSFFSQKNFAWLLDDQEERKFIKLMQKATDVIVKARTTKGAETTDHYSMMGFTKAYNTAKKTCS